MNKSVSISIPTPTVTTKPNTTTMHMGMALRVHSVNKSYSESSRAIQVLQDINLDVAAGQRVAILGASGSGKSTLLHLLGGLDTPDAGTVHVGNLNWAGLNETQRAIERNSRVGFIYQFHHLLPEFTALENIAMPLRWRGLSKTAAQSQAVHWLEQVGLSARANHIPAELSGGERQRVAVARALVTQPQVLLADEPTGNLDRDNAAAIFALFLKLATESGTALVLVTHDETLAAQCNTTYRMISGSLAKV